MPSSRLLRKNLPTPSRARSRGLASTGSPRPRRGGLGSGSLSTQERPAILGRGETYENRYSRTEAEYEGTDSGAQETKQRVLISAVIEYYGEPTRDFAASWKSIRCPFHDDRHASASINDVIGQFYCHGCGVHGDIFDIVGGQEGLEFLEALAFIREKF